MSNKPLFGKQGGRTENMYTISAIGQDSHRFEEAGAAVDVRDGEREARTLTLGGVRFPGEAPLRGASDADVALHALCNAISGATGCNILGAVADRMLLEEGITDSAAYVKAAMEHLAGDKIVHVSFSIECARPIISPRIAEMRESVAKILGIGARDVCVTATSGEGLTDFGRGLGVQVFCVVTVLKK